MKKKKDKEPIKQGQLIIMVRPIYSIHLKKKEETSSQKTEKESQVKIITRH